MNIEISKEMAGKRLDAVLLLSMQDITRSQIQKMIRGGLILVNQKNVKSGYVVRVGDSINVNDEERVERVLPTLTPIVLDETAEFIVIDKPSGLTVHPAARSKGSTLVDWLIDKYPEIEKVGDDPLRPGIVHRLDKDASGVMVVARTNDSFEALKRQFKLRRVEKEYLVLAHGKVSPEQGDITFSLARSKQERTKFVASNIGRAAHTSYVVERYFDEASLVRAMPSTGRTHQIRVHFYAKGNPLVGDPIYKKKGAITSAERLMLHAYRLVFNDLSGQKRDYVCNPDQSFESIVGRFSV